MTFAKAIQGQETTTTNGMEAYQSTMNYCVDLFGKIASSRNQDITPMFIKAYDENREIALKIAQWARDVRGGAGERKVYKDIMKYLETKNKDDAKLLASNAPEIGRYDDILCFETQEMKNYAFDILKTALEAKSVMVAKWCPAESKANKNLAREFAKYLGMTPKAYRKMLVSLKNVVETPMCSKDYSSIEYSHVPSVAMARYKKAFYKNDSDNFSKYIESVQKGEQKINASAVFPHDVIRTVFKDSNNVWYTTPDIDQATLAQWNALPNYVGDSSILPVVDVSGSMSWVAISGKLYPIHVALALGLYLADKNSGAFKDCFVSFSEKPVVEILKGDLKDKIIQMTRSHVGGSTNIEATFKKILEVAQTGKVSLEDMPKYILILSDMQFDSCNQGYSNSALKMIKEQYKEAGYKVPNIIFWNLNSHDNVPVRFDDKGTALISGFSPVILKAVLGADLDNLTPKSIMMNAINNPRYIC